MECSSCRDADTLTYQWTMSDVTDAQNPFNITGDDVEKLVEEGDVTSSVFTTSRAGNVFLERLFEVCVAGSQTCYSTTRTPFSPLPFVLLLCAMSSFTLTHIYGPTAHIGTFVHRSGKFGSLV